ncbi:MAG: tRNA epoxyqueuosine(34) reductase QueG [Gammaproteobacteria bacterium]|nr:tRNA epoxyqueuosine(34) reductase QueG [Gammaproteobacteria bacterium]
MSPTHPETIDLPRLREKIERWARELGFQSLGISSGQLTQAESHLLEWLDRGYHGTMTYMSRHGSARTRPHELLPGTVRIISVRMDYRPEDVVDSLAGLEDLRNGYVARYAVGRDYHRLMRRRLQRLADHIADAIGPFLYRAFTDSAPVMEKPLASHAGLGWIGKHTNLINKNSGSFFFIGELYTDLPLPVDGPVTDHCGECSRCITACPTGAIVGPYQLDARRCISYLTIELKGSIPIELRASIGNRIFGCDDCQLVCPWNRFSQPTEEIGFALNPQFAAPPLVSLLAWDEDQFLRNTSGTALRRITHEQWLRNVAVAIGNGPRDQAALEVLTDRLAHPSPMVREHVVWALAQLQKVTRPVDQQ